MERRLYSMEQEPKDEGGGMAYLAGSWYPPVILASPVRQPEGAEGRGVVE